MSDISHDENEIIYDKNEITHDENEITHDENEITHDENEITHDENEIIHDENEIIYDKNERIHDENEITHDENEIIHDENEIIYDKNERIHDENEKIYDEISYSHSPHVNYDDEILSKKQVNVEPSMFRKTKKRCTPKLIHDVPLTIYGKEKILLYFIFSFIFVLLIIYFYNKHVIKKSNSIIKKSIFTSIFGSNNTDDFEKTFYILIFGLLILIVAISIIYNIDYYDVPYAKTFATFSKPNYLLLLIGSSTIKSIFGIMIAIIIILMRGGQLKNHTNILSFLAIMLFSYDCLLEICGYNKWLAQDEISKCESPYNDITDVLPSDDIDIQTRNMNIINISQKGDPFLLSFSKLSVTFVIGCFIFLMIKLFIITEKNVKIHKLGTSEFKFIIEILIIGILSMISIYLSSKIKKNKYKILSTNNIILGNIIPIVLHIMFEFNNVYAIL